MEIQKVTDTAFAKYGKSDVRYSGRADLKKRWNTRRFRKM